MKTFIAVLAISGASTASAAVARQARQTQPLGFFYQPAFEPRRARDSEPEASAAPATTAAPSYEQSSAAPATTAAPSAEPRIYYKPVEQPKYQPSAPAAPAYPQPPSYAQPSYPSPSYPNVPAQYSFDWRVLDEYTQNDYGHKENREDKQTSGEYFVQLPDGRRQKVTYSVDGYGGYQAEVTYEGEAQYPEEKPKSYAPSYPPQPAAPAYPSPTPRTSYPTTTKKPAPAPTYPSPAPPSYPSPTPARSYPSPAPPARTYPTQPVYKPAQPAASNIRRYSFRPVAAASEPAPVVEEAPAQEEQVYAESRKETVVAEPEAPVASDEAKSYEIEADASSEAKGEVRIYRHTPKNVKPYEIYYKYV